MCASAEQSPCSEQCLQHIAAYPPLVWTGVPDLLTGCAPAEHPACCRQPLQHIVAPTQACSQSEFVLITLRIECLHISAVHNPYSTMVDPGSLA